MIPESTVIRERRAAKPKSAEAGERRHPIQIAWIELRKHGEACDVCGDLIAQLAQVPDDPRRADRELHPQFCADGRELHGAWVASKDEWLETTREGRRRLGVLGASQEAVELRAAAWARLPDHERARVWELEDAERFRILEAVEAGILAERRAVNLASTAHDERRAVASASTELRERPASIHESTGPAEWPWSRPGGGRQPRVCQQCGREHQSHDRYCSPECRRRAAAARLERTE